MIRVCAGVSRAVLLVGPWAIKVPRASSWKAFLWGLLANMQEADLGSRGWPELCPVRFTLPGGFLVIMERAEVCTVERAPAEADYRRLTNVEGRCVPAEWKPSSWGRLPDGRLVAVDYG